MQSCEVVPFASLARKPSGTSRGALRSAIERKIEALIAILDELDGDPDAEDDGTAEPSLGWSFTYAGGSGDDCEDTSPEWHGGAA